MKKLIMLFAAVLTLGIASGCAADKNTLVEGKINVVTSFFPLYDFSKQIGGDHVNVVNMVPTGVEPHDWTPKSRDMTNIAKAQMFVYQGAGFEGWTEDVLGGIDKSKLVVVEASKGIELLPASPNAHDEHDEHDEHDDHDDHDDHASESHGSHAEGGFDPHTWLSPSSALIMAENIKNGLTEADPEHAADYESNYEALAAQIKALDDSFRQQLSGVSKREIVVQHQAFGYLARDYGLVEVSLMGLSHEAEPTAQNLKEISDFIKEHDVHYIFTEELLSDALAKTLANDLGVETLVLHPLEGLTDEEAKSGATYVSLMEQNLNHLLKALQ
ncbi:metal ABC transporter substrate-binding protein [Paenibacillus thermotolerans]|uniref:metal ABC transporter substrate-binding protein n=1 Tax=Paenibacillus thermotolerans TaxID=3027807 RepID=UPI0023683B4D|nr:MULTISPECIES: metal ABC transporter substrate-binding protein [unclassified Paenibacillus]